MNEAKEWAKAGGEIMFGALVVLLIVVLTLFIIPLLVSKAVELGVILGEKL